jgi:hypothetical protein
MIRDLTGVSGLKVVRAILAAGRPRNTSSGGWAWRGAANKAANAKAASRRIATGRPNVLRDVAGAGPERGQGLGRLLPALAGGSEDCASGKYLEAARRFLAHRFPDGKLYLKKLQARDVTDFVLHDTFHGELIFTSGKKTCNSVE